MRLSKLLLMFLASILIAAILTSSSLAAIQTVTYKSDLSNKTIGGSRNHTLNYFDPALGKLLKVDFTASENVSMRGSAENTGEEPVAGHILDQTYFGVKMVNGNKLVLNVNLRVPSTGETSVSAWDGTDDFLGPDSFSGSDSGNTHGHVSYTLPNDVALYVGTGKLNLTTNSSANSNVYGGGNWRNDIRTYIYSNATITYNYDDSRCISGYKIDGCTNTGLSGWTINVSNTTHYWLNTTNATGYWQVCGLDNHGTFTVCEEQKAGWTQTKPVPSCYTETINGANITKINFTNVKNRCISGHKYNACTGTALKDWTINVYNATTQNFNGTSTTNATGYWEVCGLV
ncbi:MAG: choice-of-anchor E domain-containing protein, partial [Methanothrix sp.]|nr:choice-of-anchor E domain-containing protein [Methanothrix sp.]